MKINLISSGDRDSKWTEHATHMGPDWQMQTPTATNNTGVSAHTPPVFLVAVVVYTNRKCQRQWHPQRMRALAPANAPIHAFQPRMPIPKATDPHETVLSCSGTNVHSCFTISSEWRRKLRSFGACSELRRRSNARRWDGRKHVPPNVVTNPTFDPQKSSATGGRERWANFLDPSPPWTTD